MVRLWLVRNRNREAVGPAAQKLLLPKGTRSAPLLRFELAAPGPDRTPPLRFPRNMLPRLPDLFFYFLFCLFFGGKVSLALALSIHNKLNYRPTQCVRGA
jgi:hypothetical protein